MQFKAYESFCYNKCHMNNLPIFLDNLFKAAIFFSASQFLGKQGRGCVCWGSLLFWQ